jgi:hydrogenase maturation protease
VIGLGNELRGDDAAGLLAVRRLGSLPRPRPVRVLEHSGDCLSLLQRWRGAHAVVLLDAARSGAPVGSVTVFDASRQPCPASLRADSSHAFGVAETIELARTLGELPPVVVVYAIEGSEFGYGAPLSEAVADALPATAANAHRRALAIFTATGSPGPPVGSSSPTRCRTTR